MTCLVLVVASCATDTGDASALEVSLTEYLAHIENPEHEAREVVLKETGGLGELIATIKDPGWRVVEQGETKYYERIRVVVPPAFIHDFEGLSRLMKNIPPSKFHYEEK